MKEGIIIGVLIVVLVGLFILSSFRRKKFNQEMNQMRTDLKIGDKVMTDSGLVGEISETYEEDGSKFFVLKSGGVINYGYFTVHANAVYYAFNKEGVKDSETTKESTSEVKEEQEVVISEDKQVEEKPKKTRKSKN